MTARPSIAACAQAMVLAAALGGCATGYGTVGLTAGYIDKMLAPDIGLVVVAGNGFTSPDKIEAIARLRAAELTLEKGFQRFSMFTVVDQATKEASDAGTLPAFLREKAAHEAGGSPRSVQETTTTYNNGMVLSVTKPSTGVYVVMTRDRARGAYDAAKVVAELRPRLAPAPNEAPVTPSDRRQ